MAAMFYRQAHGTIIIYQLNTIRHRAFAVAGLMMLNSLPQNYVTNPTALTV